MSQGNHRNSILQMVQSTDMFKPSQIEQIIDGLMKNQPKMEESDHNNSMQESQGEPLNEQRGFEHLLKINDYVTEDIKVGEIKDIHLQVSTMQNAFALEQEERQRYENEIGELKSQVSQLLQEKNQLDLQRINKYLKEEQQIQERQVQIENEELEFLKKKNQELVS